MSKKNKIKELNIELKRLDSEVINDLKLVRKNNRLDMDLVIIIQNKQNKILEIKRKLKFLSQGKCFLGKPINTISIKVHTI